MVLTNETPTNEANAVAGRAAPAADSKAKAGPNSKAETKSATESAGSSRKAAATGKTIKSKAKPATRSTETKASIVIKKLNPPKGATIETLMEATGWQAHSVRGFLSAVVKKKLGLNLVNDVGKDGVRRYRINDASNAK